MKNACFPLPGLHELIEEEDEAVPHRRREIENSALRWPVVFLVLLAGFILLFMFVFAPPCRAAKATWPKLEGPGCTLEIRRNPLAPIPYDADAASDRAMRWAALQASDERASEFWRYVRDRQGSTDWFLIRIEPHDRKADLVWKPGDRLIFILGDSSHVAAQVVTSTSCQDFDSPCDLLPMPAAVAWEDIATAGGWCAYAGVPRDRIRAHGVLGVQMEVTP